MKVTNDGLVQSAVPLVLTSVLNGHHECQNELAGGLVVRKDVVSREEGRLAQQLVATLDRFVPAST
jgi:hypothetical protein